MGRVYFTLDEAQRLIPTVEKKLEKLWELNEEISVLSTAKVQYNEPGLENELLVLGLSKKYHALLFEFYKELEDLTKLGVVVKDLKEGIVDFYSKLDKKDILLCYKLNDKKIHYWHDTESGYDGRQPISILRRDYEKKLKNLL